ncbi:hypothetical protein [Novosphingobium capsulatum]|uniref:hypothetical protein n=1 Tax=Novosphingobium capsulatum TaxID=13688 RepID=UPI0035B562A7
MYAEGLTQAEIGVALGLTQKIVFNVMRRHSIRARVAAKRDQFGSSNHAWKGDLAGKSALHRRLYSRFGKPSHCSQCGTSEAAHYDYANLTGQYEDLEDYAPMCRSCHWKYDEKILNITRVLESSHG